MKSMKNFEIEDCEVDDFQPGECSLKCKDSEGNPGKQTLKRSIVQKNNENGHKCPKLEWEMTCNNFECPEDCEMSGWSSFSKCTKECEGGVRSRTRSIKRERKNGGEPCGEVSESK